MKTVTMTPDFGMYYSGTFARVRDKVVSIMSGDIDEQIVMCQDAFSDGRKVLNVPVRDIDFSPPMFGYKQVGETVVYTSRRPSRTVKKAFSPDTLCTWWPQEQEYVLINKMLPSFKTAGVFNEYVTPIHDIDEQLENKFALVITKFFAIVKKATHEFPILYYRDIPVAEYLGSGKFRPLNNNDDILEKMYLEYSDVRY